MTAEPFGLTAEAGFGGHVVENAWTPLTVTVAPERTFAGRLEITAGGNVGTVVVDRDVEVTGGSPKQYRVVVPPSNRIAVEATSDEGRESTSVSPRLNAMGSDAILVGLLTGSSGVTELRDVPSTDAQPTGQRITYAPVDPAWLNISTRALDGVDTLVVRAATLGTLPDTSVHHLASAVAAGLDLVVIATDPGAVPVGRLGLTGVPDVTGDAPGNFEPGARPGGPTGSYIALTTTGTAWQMTTEDVGAAGNDVLAVAARAGRGRVAVTGVDVATAIGNRWATSVWARLLQPGPVRPPDGGFQNQSLEVLSLGSRGVGLPGVGMLALFVLGYVIVVGPVTGIVLSRLDRRDLAWIVVPAVTLVFAGLAFGVTGRASPRVGVSATGHWWLGGSGGEVVAAAVRAPRGGNHTLRLDGTWDVESWTFRAPARVSNDAGDATSVEMDLEPLEVGTVLGHRTLPDPSPAPLEVSVVNVDGHLEVTVANVSTTAVETEVHAGGHIIPAGRLEPGEDWQTVVDGGLVPLNPFLLGEMVIEEGGTGGPNLQEARTLLRRVLDRSPGIVWAVGKTDPAQQRAPVRADERETEHAASVIAVGAAPTVQGGRVVPAAISRDVVQVSGSGGGSFGGLNVPTAFEGADSGILRFRLPAGTGVGSIVSTLQRTADGAPRVRVECPPDQPGCDPAPADGTVEVWDDVDQRWLPTNEALAGGDADRLVTPLGEVYARVVSTGGLLEVSARGISVIPPDEGSTG